MTTAGCKSVRKPGRSWVAYETVVYKVSSGSLPNSGAGAGDGADLVHGACDYRAPDRALRPGDGACDRVEDHVYNPDTNLTLAQDDQTYSILHNSNHELAIWLEMLNCRIDHLWLWREFRLTSTR